MPQQTPHEYNTDETLAADIGHDEHGAADSETDSAELTARIAELEGRLQDEQLRSAASVTRVSGVAIAKLPPIPMNTDARPSRIARMASKSNRVSISAA